MPWTAIHDGKEKPPHQVPRGVEVECPTCGGRMARWARSSSGTASHFKHIGNMGHGDGGGGGGNPDCESVSESNQHKVWKSFAADAVLNAFEGNVSDYEGYDQDDKRELVKESGLEAPASDKEWRVGDVVLTFDKPDTQLGRGMIIEVQHKNESKDIDATTSDYVQQGYSVVWLDESDFAKDRCKLLEVDFRHRAFQSAWPDHVPKHDDWWSSEYSHKKLSDTKWRHAHSLDLVKSGAPATLPPEWCDEMALKIWRNQPWDELFDPPTEPVYRLRAAIPKIAKSQRQTVKFSPPVFDEIGYLQVGWDEMFDSYPWEDLASAHKPTPLEIDIAPFLSKGFWQSAFLDGKATEIKNRESLERPTGPFDDIQCHNCGNYNYAPNVGKKCDSCGTDWDWEWNLATNRISKGSIPDQFREEILRDGD